MCGICGLVRLDGGTVDPAPLADMAESLRHRGPDSDGQLVNGPVALAVRRLAIIDVEGGDQPLANEDASVHVVQNGEIYNHAELRRRLEQRGHRFATRSDTEVLVHLYEEHGDGFVHELRGMFAIALWDARRRRLVLARDRFGIKPLYWRVDAGVLSFASELGTLRPAAIDLDALESFLAFNSVPAPLSIRQDTRKLPPGHLLVWEGRNQPRVERYARVKPASAAAVRRESEHALAEELRSRLRDSVRAHLVADVPVAVLLSGGIDSSTVAVLAAAEAPGTLRTFSVGFDERSFDERAGARLVAAHAGSRHEEIVLRPDPELVARVFEAFDEPFGDSSALPTYAVCELAARNVKVVLSGEGGDELFGGYHTYVADLMAPRLAPVATVVRPLVELLPTSTRRVSLDYRAKRFVRAAHLPPLERHHGWKEIFSDDARAELLAEGRRGRLDPLEPLRARFAETEGAELLARLQDVDLGVYLVDDLLVKTDRASMAHSLEARVPFLDPVVAELALALPTHMKVRALQKKRLLRMAVSPLLPAAIVRGGKRGFSIPATSWLRDELRPFARDVLAPDRIRGQGFFRPEAVSRLLDAHVAGREDLSRQLWGLIAFSLWYERQAGAREPLAA
jgi:asparagine synthase (glutamine-hydrolysing)